MERFYYQDSIGKDRYTSLQIKAQRPFANGYNFLIGYNYNHEQTLQYFNDINQYANHLSWREQPSPRHRLTAAAIYELPFGKSRKYMTSAPYVVDAVIGGWQVSGTYTYHGAYPTRRHAQFPLFINDPSFRQLAQHFRLHELRKRVGIGVRAMETVATAELLLDKWLLPRWGQYQATDMKPLEIEAWFETLACNPAGNVNARLSWASVVKLKSIMSQVFQTRAA